MHDTKRSTYLIAQGYRVIRFRNEDIFGDLGPVLTAISDALSEGPSPSHQRESVGGPQPSPQEGEGFSVGVYRNALSP